MFVSIIQFFYPDIKKEEVLKFSLLALALCLILGAYWQVRLLKDMFFYMRLGFPIALGWDPDYGRSLIPIIKMISPFIITSMVIIYSKLLTTFAKDKLFYIFCSFYAIIFGLVAFATFILENFGPEYIGKYPLATLSILIYLLTESFGSLVVSLFWSLAITSNETDEAKRSFPFIIAAAQIGTISGSSLLIAAYPLWIYYTICTLTILCVMIVINQIVKRTPADQLISQKNETEDEPTILAGLHLLLTKPYFLGVFIVSTFYEIIKTFIDFQMKSQASLFMTESAYTIFSGWFGFWTNLTAFLIALLGTSYMMKEYGLRFCILLSPICYGIVVTALYIYYTTNPAPEYLFYANFVTMIFVTAISYAVNNPTKEIMEIPIRFQLKTVINTVGSRGAKAFASSINNSLNVGASTALKVANLVAFGTLFGLGFIIIWTIAAWYVGNKNAQLVRDNQTIK